VRPLGRCPRHHRVHFAKELLAPRRALLACVLGAGKAGLLHGHVVAAPSSLRYRGLHGRISDSQMQYVRHKKVYG
jgi:hypothetical protein